MNKVIILLIGFVFCFTPACTQQSESYWEVLPDPEGKVNDFEHILSDVEEHLLDSLVKEYERRTTVQIAIITIPENATASERFDTLIIHIANTWGVGQEDTDNGIVIAISDAHRRIRIVNGYGIEPILSDAQTLEILEKYMIPHLKEGRYFQGLFDGIQEIKKILSPQVPDQYVHLNEMTVFEFLELVKVDQKNPLVLVGSKAPVDWLTPSDIDSLITLIDAKEPTKMLFVGYTDEYLAANSTLGGYVMDILEAHINKEQFPVRQTEIPRADFNRKERLLKWYHEQKK